MHNIRSIEEKVKLIRSFIPHFRAKKYILGHWAENNGFWRPGASAPPNSPKQLFMLYLNGAIGFSIGVNPAEILLDKQMWVH